MSQVRGHRGLAVFCLLGLVGGYLATWHDSDGATGRCRRFVLASDVGTGRGRGPTPAANSMPAFRSRRLRAVEGLMPPIEGKRQA
jgi:hypothetical protein